MKILYVDDAGNTGTDYDNPSQPFFSLLGLIVNDSDWCNLNSTINQRKIEILSDFATHEIHAVDIFNCKKIGTTNFRNLQEYQNLKILEQIVDLIVDINCPIVQFTVRKQNLKRYCELKCKEKPPIDPYLIAFTYLSHFFDDYVSENKEHGLMILDEQEALTENIADMLQVFQIHNADEQIKIERIIETSLFLSSASSNFIQLADVCNFYINRHNTNLFLKRDKNNIKYEHTEKMYEKISKLKIKCDPFKYTTMLEFIEKTFS